MYIGTSLDGFIARKDGNLDWLVKFQSQEIFSSYEEFIRNIDAIVIGRGTFETVLTYPSWPYDKKVFVLSRSIKQLPEKIGEKATLVSARPQELLNRLAKEGCSNIYVDGGKVIQDFLREDCIDELIVTKVPVLIGNGIPLFGVLDKDLPFEHKETTVLSNGLVRSHYERKRT